MLCLYICVFLGFLFAPIVIITLFSFNATPSLVFPLEGFSLRWYHALFQNTNFLTSLVNSVKVGVAASIVTTVLGTLVGLALIRMPMRWRTALEVMTLAPIGMPGLFLGISLAVLFAQLGWARTLLTVTIAHVLFALPFFVEAMRSRITYFDHSIEEAARDLGASPAIAFWTVTFPILAPTIVGGAILSFALSFDEFIITVFVGGNDTTLPLFIFSMMRRTVDPSINAASVLAVIVSLMAIAAAGGYFWLKRRTVLAARGQGL